MNEYRINKVLVYIVSHTFLITTNVICWPLAVDPANELPCYSATVDVSELITVDDAMTHLRLGPNGALVYCMEYLEQHCDWLTEKINRLDGHYFIIDCPGQVGRLGVAFNYYLSETVTGFISLNSLVWFAFLRVQLSL